MAKELYKYILCEQWQDKKDGKMIETDINMNKCKDFNVFLKKLYEKKQISEEEFNKIDSAYYA